LLAGTAVAAVIPGAAVPALANAATVAAAPLAPLFHEWFGLDAAYEKLYSELTYIDVDEVPRAARYDDLYDLLTGTPAEDFVDIAMKIAVAAKRDEDWIQSRLVNSAAKDARRVLEAAGIDPDPEPTTFSDAEWMEARRFNAEGKKSSEAYFAQHEAERAQEEAKKARVLSPEEARAKRVAFMLSMFSDEGSDPYLDDEGRRQVLHGFNKIMESKQA
jgi:hypothetical protein